MTYGCHQGGDFFKQLYCANAIAKFSDTGSKVYGTVLILKLCVSSVTHCSVVTALSVLIHHCLIRLLNHTLYAETWPFKDRKSYLFSPCVQRFNTVKTLHKDVTILTHWT